MCSFLRGHGGVVMPPSSLKTKGRPDYEGPEPWENAGGGRWSVQEFKQQSDTAKFTVFRSLCTLTHLLVGVEMGTAFMERH